MFERLDPTDGCSRATEAVAFVQRELDGADAARYAAHLDACVACREAVAEYRGLLCELGCDRDRALRELGDLPRVRVAPPARRLGVAAAAILVVAVSVWAIMDYHGVSSGAFVASGEPGTEAQRLK